MDTVVHRIQEEFRKANMDLSIRHEGGRLFVQHNQFGSRHDFQASSSTDGILSEEGGTFQNAVIGNDIRGKINGETAFGEGNVMKAAPGNPTTDGLEIRYIGDVGGEDGSDLPDAGVNVGSVVVYQNSLNFQVGPSSNQNLGFSLGSVSTKRLGTGVINESEFSSLREINVMNPGGANDSMLIIEKAIDQLSTLRGELGAFQRNNLESNVIALRWQGKT